MSKVTREWRKKGAQMTQKVTPVCKLDTKSSIAMKTSTQCQRQFQYALAHINIDDVNMMKILMPDKSLENA